MNGWREVPNILLFFVRLQSYHFSLAWHVHHHVAEEKSEIQNLLILVHSKRLPHHQLDQRSTQPNSKQTLHPNPVHQIVLVDVYPTN